MGPANTLLNGVFQQPARPLFQGTSSVGEEKEIE